MDLAEPYIRLLSAMASAAGVAFSGPAAPFVAPLLDGLGGLMQAATREGLEIGISRQFRRPRARLFAIFGLNDSAGIRPRLSRANLGYAGSLGRSAGQRDTFLISCSQCRGCQIVTIGASCLVLGRLIGAPGVRLNLAEGPATYASFSLHLNGQRD